MKQVFQLSFLFAILTFIACGGPPGFDDDDDGPSNEGNAAKVSIDTFPRKIDSGDVTTVSVRFSDVSNIFQMKVRTDKSFSYIDNSAFLVSDGDDSQAHLYSAQSVKSKGYRYIVIDFNEMDHFGDSRSGTLSFHIRGARKVSTKIAVDVDRKATVDEDNFVASRPRFTELTDVSIEVEE